MDFNNNLDKFLKTANEKLDFEKSQAILKTLKNNGNLNLDELSIKSNVNRSSLNKYLAPLELLGYIEHTKVGVSKNYMITELGTKYYSEYFKG